MIRQQKIFYISSILILGFCASVAYHLFVAYVLHMNYYPYNTFLFRPDDLFGDFFDNFNAGRFPYLEIKASRAMFPLFMLLCRVMYLIDHKIILLWLYLPMFLTLLAIEIYDNLKNEKARIRALFMLSLIICSYPVLISLDRANFENGVFLLVAISIECLRREKYILSSIFLGIATAIKPYSAFFFPILLFEGQFVSILLALGITGGLSLISLFILSPSPLVGINILRTNLNLYNLNYVVKNEGLYFGNSIFGLIKGMAYIIADKFHLFSNSSDVLNFNQSLMQPYLLITLSVFLVTLLLLFIYQAQFWKKVAILAICLNVLPYVGSSYRLLYLFVPLLLYVTTEFKEHFDKIYTILFGLLLIPQGYIHFSFSPIFMANPGEMDGSVLLTPIILTLLMIFILIDIVRCGSNSELFLNVRERIRSKYLLIRLRREEA